MCIFYTICNAILSLFKPKKYVTDRLVSLMCAVIENSVRPANDGHNHLRGYDVFTHYLCWIKTRYENWVQLLSLCSESDICLKCCVKDILTHFPQAQSFDVGHAMCLCAFITDVCVLKLKRTSLDYRSIVNLVTRHMTHTNLEACIKYLDIIDSGVTVMEKKNFFL